MKLFSTLLVAVFFCVSNQVVAAPMVSSIIQYGSTVDLVNKEVTFSVLFDSPPDLTITNSTDRFIQGIGIDLDPNGRLPGIGRKDGQDNFQVWPDYRVLSCAARPVTCQGGTYTVYDYESNPVGGFGSVPFTVTENLFSITVSFLLLNETDGFFTYAITDAKEGLVDQFLFGTSGDQYSEPFIQARSIPEPPSILLFLAVIFWVYSKKVLKFKQQLGM